MRRRAGVLRNTAVASKFFGVWADPGHVVALHTQAGGVAIGTAGAIGERAVDNCLVVGGDEVNAVAVNVVKILLEMLATLVVSMRFTHVMRIPSKNG